jgi:hypothetical protein
VWGSTMHSRWFRESAQRLVDDDVRWRAMSGAVLKWSFLRVVKLNDPRIEGKSHLKIAISHPLIEVRTFFAFFDLGIKSLPLF